MENPAFAESCQFFVKRKKRLCRMTVKAGNSFCGEHMGTNANKDETQRNESKSRRVTCPIDSTHTCYESRLIRHLKVCNAKRLAEAQPSYIVKGINLDNTECPKRVPLSELSQCLIDSVIKKVEAAHARLPAINEEILCDDTLKEELNNRSYGHGLRKHLLQNASLLGHLKNSGLAKKKTCFVEFGAGKGKLTYWLARAIGNETGSSVLLVDRSSHRHKSDNKLKNEDCQMGISRIRADIGDLRLSDVPEIQNIDHVVGIAKHLCGSATDLTIRCLAGLMHDEDPNHRVAGLIVAFCCHHRCEYSSYVGKKYLLGCGFTSDEFPILCSIASWATCSTGRNRNATANDEEKNDKIVERERIGGKVKSLLNWGRIEYLRSLGFDSNLVYYTTRNVSLENMCMISVRKKLH